MRLKTVPAAFAFLLLAGFGASVTVAQEAKKPEDADTFGPGDHTRSLKMGKQERSFLVHVPKGYDSKKPTPVVLALHGALMNGPMMVWFAGLNKKADQENFIVVYPSGLGMVWNAGNMGSKTDDVAFIRKTLDDLETVVSVDKKRVYACGMSNGAMMCYRLAAELSDRIAAIARVVGINLVNEIKPKRPVPVLHFHGTKDTLVPFEGKLRSVDDSIQKWVKLNSCDEKSKEDVLSKVGDEMKVTRKTYGSGKNGAEVVLVIIEDGGHTWPGQKPPVGFMGKSAMNISANDLIWEFFKKHPMKE
jgi:polyhydroxybutyrate depolymerase